MITRDTGLLWLTIVEKKEITCDVWRSRLTGPQSAPLLSFEAGSNLIIVVPNGMHRSYSLCNDSQEGHRYIIAVKRDNDDHGSSMSLIDDTSTDGLIDIFLPWNKPPLDERAESFILIAGGIDITPVLPVARQLKAERLWDFKLYYLTHDPEGIAFLDELSSDQRRSRVKIHHDLGDPTKSPNSWTLLERPRAAHIYCCRP